MSGVSNHSGGCLVDNGHDRHRISTMNLSAEMRSADTLVLPPLPRADAPAGRHQVRPARSRPAHRRVKTARPISLATWFCLAVGLGSGTLLARSYVYGSRFLGLVLLLILVPLTMSVLVAGAWRGFGSGKSALVTAAFLTFAVLRLSYFF